MNQLRKELRDAYNRHVMADHEFKIVRRKFTLSVRDLGKALRKQYCVLDGSWLKTQNIVCSEGAAGLGISCTFSSTNLQLVQRIVDELTARGWVVYSTTIFVQHTEIKAY